jgi:hypothetical protein
MFKIEMVESGITTSRCGCGANATKLVSAPSFHLDGSTGDFPGQHMKWVREHEKAGRKKSPQ